MKKSLALMLALIMVLCMIPTTAFAANMSWTWTVTIFGGNYYRANGTETTTNKYTINRHLDNSVPHEIGYKFEWNASAGGNNYNGGWQLCLTVDGKIVERSTAYIYERDMSNASGTWTAPASSHTGNSSHPFTLYLSDYPARFQKITLTYDANGGTGAPASETKQVEKGQSATFTVSTQEPTRENYTFKGWSTNKNATTAEFIGGNSITISQNTTLYAVWEENNTPSETPTPPTPGPSETPTPPTPGTDPTPPPSAAPSVPGADSLKYLLDKIKVTCVTNNTAHGTKEFDLIDGSYTVGAVEGNAISGYTCDITVHPALYVAEYVNDLGIPHTLSPAGQTGTITLIYDAEEQAWKPMPTDPIVFNVTCSDEDETFTVTYLDGFSGTYATYPNLKYGDATPVPANPYRSGYIFLGWEPSVAPTVTGDARYVAQWGYIGPQYPNPMPVQPVQPGIRPPQTGDMPLWYAIARFLGLVK